MRSLALVVAGACVVVLFAGCSGGSNFVKPPAGAEVGVWNLKADFTAGTGAGATTYVAVSGTNRSHIEFDAPVGGAPAVATGTMYTSGSATPVVASGTYARNGSKVTMTVDWGGGRSVQVTFFFTSATTMTASWKEYLNGVLNASGSAQFVLAPPV